MIVQVHCNGDLEIKKVLLLQEDFNSQLCVSHPYVRALQKFAFVKLNR